MGRRVVETTTTNEKETPAILQNKTTADVVLIPPPKDSTVTVSLPPPPPSGENCVKKLDATVNAHDTVKSTIELVLPPPQKEKERAEVNNSGTLENTIESKSMLAKIATGTIKASVIPPSPPPGPPSALTVAMTRLSDLTAQMEYQYTKHLQLTKKHKLIQAKISLLKRLPIGLDAIRDDLEKLANEEMGNNSSKE